MTMRDPWGRVKLSPINEAPAADTCLSFFQQQERERRTRRSPSVSQDDEDVCWPAGRIEEKRRACVRHRKNYRPTGLAWRVAGFVCAHRSTTRCHFPLVTFLAPGGRSGISRFRARPGLLFFSFLFCFSFSFLFLSFLFVAFFFCHLYIISKIYILIKCSDF